MAEEVTTEERNFTVTHEDGTVSEVKGTITTTDHGETDEDGYPKVSVHVAASPIDAPAPAPVHIADIETLTEESTEK